MYRNEPPRVLQPVVKPAQSPSTTGLPPSKIELPSQAADVKSSLDDTFARLSSATPSVPSRPAAELSKTGLDRSMFIFDDRADDNAAAAGATLSDPTNTPSQNRPALALPATEPLNAAPTETLHAAQQSPSTSSLDADEREAAYFQKAVAYLENLPTSPGDMAHNIKGVTRKLHTVYAPNLGNTEQDEVEKLRARIAFAVTSAANKKVKLSSEPLTTDMVKKTLRDCEGDFLQLCAALVKSGHIALGDLKHVTELCQTVLDVLPKADDGLSTETSSKASATDDSHRPAASMAPLEKPNVQTANGETAKVVVGKTTNADPLAGMKAWPTQEKREHGT